MKVTVKVSGLKEIEKALFEIDKESTRKALVKRVLKKAGEPIASAMRAKAPVDDGDLSKNIIVSAKIKGGPGEAAYAKAMRESAGNKAYAVKAMRDARRAAKGTMPPVMMFVGPTERIFHAHLVEFGTKAHINGGLFAGSKHPGTRAQPFARPAFDAESGNVLSMISDQLRDEIMKSVKRQAQRKAKANG